MINVEIFFCSEFESEEEESGEPKSANAGIGDWLKFPELPELPELPLPKLPIPSLFGGSSSNGKAKGPQAKLDDVVQPLTFGDNAVSCNLISSISMFEFTLFQKVHICALRAIRRYRFHQRL